MNDTKKFSAQYLLIASTFIIGQVWDTLLLIYLEYSPRLFP